MTQEQLDLIERYLDGKASPAEASELMESMKEDPSLASDMEAMSTLHTTVDEDLAAITLPDHLYGSIVHEAVSAGTLGAASGTTTATWLSSTSNTILSLVLAAAMVTAVGTWTAFERSMSDSATPLAVVPPVPPSDVPQTAPDLMSSSNDQQLPATSAAPLIASDDGSMEPVTASHGAVSAPESNGITATPQVDEEESPSHQLFDQRVERTQEVHSLPAERPVSIQTASYESAPALVVGEHDDLLDGGSDRAPAVMTVPTETITYQQRPPITIRALQRPISGFSYNATTTESALSSLALEVEVGVADNQFVGLGVHHDLFPVQLENGAGDPTAAPFMTWYGAHYRWMPMTDLPLGMRPFLHLGAGGSSRGFTVQPAAGLMIPVGSMQLGVGADVVGLAFQNQGTWSTAFSPALRIELGYSW